MPFIFTFNDLSSTWTPRRSSGKESACQCRRYKRPGFNPCVGKSSWRGKWQPTPVFLLRKSHGQRCLVGYSLWDHKESDMTEHIHYYFILSYNKIMIHILVSLGLTLCHFVYDFIYSFRELFPLCMSFVFCRNINIFNAQFLFFS